MNNQNTLEVVNCQSSPSLVRKIGNVTYIVDVHFEENAKEQLENKLLNVVKNMIDSLKYISLVS